MTDGQFDWDGYFAKQGGGSAPQPAGTPASYDWNNHFQSLAPQPAGAQPTTQYSGALRPLALAGKAIGAGVSDLIAAPGNLARMVLGRAPTPAESSVLGIPPSSEDLTPVTNALGVTGTPQVTPQTAAEKYGTAAVSGVASGLTAAATGGAPLLMAASGAAGNLAGEATHEALPKSTWTPVVAGVLGGMGVGGVAGKIAESVGATRAAKALEEAQANLEAAHDTKFYQGENARKQADSIADASKAAMEAKLGLIDTVRTGAAQAAQEGFETSAGKLGDSSTLQEAGQSLQASARQWVNSTLPSKLAETWAPVDAAIPKNLELNLNNFNEALKGITTSAGELEKVNSLLKPGLPSKIKAALDAPEALKELTLDGPAPESTYTWQDVSKLRTTLGDALHNPQIVKDVGAQNLDKLYASLSSDMGEGAQRAGASDLFNAANLESRRLYQIAEGPISRVISSPRASGEELLPEKVAGGLLTGGKKGASDLATLRDEIPEGVDELAAHQLRQGPGTWSKLSPEAQLALVPDEGVRGQLAGFSQSMTQAEENAEREILAAKRDHAETSAAASEAKRTGDFSRSEQVRLAQKAVAQAKAQIPAPPNPVSNLVHKGNQLLGAGLGYNFAPEVLRHLEITPNPLALGAITAAGLALPHLGRSLKNVIRNPSSALPGIVGGAAGGNPLVLEPTQQ